MGFIDFDQSGIKKFYRERGFALCLTILLYNCHGKPLICKHGDPNKRKIENFESLTIDDLVYWLGNISLTHIRFFSIYLKISTPKVFASKQMDIFALAEKPITHGLCLKILAKLASYPCLVSI